MRFVRWLLRRVQNSMGAAQFRQARANSYVPPPWVPLVIGVPLFIFGAGGLVRFLYKGWWGPAAVVVVWLLALVLMTRSNYLLARSRKQQRTQGR